jgi:hypothetical protein
MSKRDEIFKYHELAKDAGNRLRSYILSVSSGATGVFFLALTGGGERSLSAPEKWLLALSLVAFVVTVALCLYELRIDAKRFFALAKELQKPEEEQRWEENERYKSKRYGLIHSSYVTLAIAIMATSIYLVLAIVGI